MEMKKQRKRRSVVGRVLQPWWRLTRGLTLGAQAVVIDDGSRVLLVRHGYRRGWHFPGGGVERGETIESAVGRELLEEAGVQYTGPAQLHGLFANNASFSGDHIAVFVIRRWKQPSIPKSNPEIVEQGFFALDELPADTDPGTRRRLDEIFNGATPNANW